MGMNEWDEDKIMDEEDKEKNVDKKDEKKKMPMKMCVEERDECEWDKCGLKKWVWLDLWIWIKTMSVMKFI